MELSSQSRQSRPLAHPTSRTRSAPGSNHYLLIKRQSLSATGKRLSASEAAAALLAKQYWPLFHRTQNQSTIAPGDRLAVYLAGDGDCLVFATAVVDSIAKWNRAFATAYPLEMSAIPTVVLCLKAVKKLKSPVCVRDHLADLSFIKSKLKWGSAFMGGLRGISASDFAVLTGSAASK